MLSRIFPKQFDNTYRGHRLAVWFLGLLMLVKATQGVNSIIMTRQVLTTADGIPLDSYGSGAAEVVVALFAITGLHTLILPLQSIVVLLRYRAMIPVTYLMFLILQLGNRLVVMAHPIVRPEGTPIGTYVNLAILAVTIVGFGLSLLDRTAATRGTS